MQTPGPSRSEGPLSLVVFIGCPHCGNRIETPFARGHGRVPVANTHPNPTHKRRHHGDRCRVVVVIDPHGESHEIHKIREGETREAAMQRVALLLRPAA